MLVQPSHQESAEFNIIKTLETTSETTETIGTKYGNMIVSAKIGSEWIYVKMEAQFPSRLFAIKKNSLSIKIVDYVSAGHMIAGRRYTPNVYH